MIRKWLAIGIILLFVSVTIAPTINFNTVKASTDDDLVEVQVHHPLLVLLLRLIYESRIHRRNILEDISSYDTHWGTVVVFPLMYWRAWRLFDKATNRVDIWIHISDLMGWGWTKEDINRPGAPVI